MSKKPINLSKELDICFNNKLNNTFNQTLYEGLRSCINKKLYFKIKNKITGKERLLIEHSLKIELQMELIKENEESEYLYAGEPDNWEWTFWEE